MYFPFCCIYLDYKQFIFFIVYHSSYHAILLESRSPSSIIIIFGVNFGRPSLLYFLSLFLRLGILNKLLTTSFLYLCLPQFLRKSETMLLLLLLFNRFYKFIAQLGEFPFVYHMFINYLCDVRNR